MKSFFYIILFLFVSTLSQQLFAQSTSDSIDHFIKQKMTQMNIPGLQLAVIKNGRLAKSAYYGFSNIEHHVATNSKSTFSINSMTKAFVGVAIMQLQERGKLKVDDAISKYILDIPDEWKSITIRQLLSNTSGLPNNIDGKEQVLGDGTEDKNWEIVKKLSMQFKPGERFSYSGEGYVYLQKIVENIEDRKSVV